MGATADKIKGKLKQIEGKLTGDKVRMAQGTAQKTKGELESAATRVVRKTKTAVRRVRDSFARKSR